MTRDPCGCTTDGAVTVVCDRHRQIGIAAIRRIRAAQGWDDRDDGAITKPATT